MLSFRFRIPNTANAAVLVVAALALAACSDASTAPRVAAPSIAESQAKAVSLSVSGSGSASSYLACPSTRSYSVSKVVGPRGGVLAIDGSAMVIPRGAVPVPTRFTFIVPASDIMQIEAHADGVEHYFFQRPVFMTIDYSRCASSVDQMPSFSAWYIDTSTRAALSWMGGVDDRQSHRLLFSTGHLSGYAVSERSGQGGDATMY